MRIGKKFTIGFLPTLLVVMAMLLVACGGGGSTSNTNSKPAPAPADKQVFRYWLLGPDISTFDPALVQDADSITAIDGVFTGLVQTDDKLQVKPQMATSWDKSSDGLTWTFHMRSGLQFSDGTPLTAQDVAYSIDRALKKSTQSPVALTYLALIKDSDKLSSGAISTIIGDSLIVQDPTTLVIKLNKPGGFFLYALTYPTSYPVEKKLVDKYGAKWTDHLTEGGGSGPFKVSVYSHSKGITEVPNSLYYGPKPQLQKLELPFYADSDTAYQAYQANQLDYTGVPSAHFAADKSLPDFRRVPQLWISYFAMNYLTKPFDDIKIRQAFDLAIDKDFIVKTVLKGRFTPSNHIVPQGMPGYSPNLTGPDGAGTTGNATMAKSLLQQGMQEEGWTSVSQIPPIKVSYSATSTDQKNEAAALAQRWQSVLGINVTLAPEDFSKLLDDINAATNNPKGLQMWFIGWIADYPDPQDWTTLQFDKGSPNNNSNYGQNHSTDAADQVQVQQQLEAADVMQDPTARYQAYNQLEQKLVNDVAWLPMYQVTANIRIKTYVQGLIINAQGLFPPDDWGSVYISTH